MARQHSDSPGNQRNRRWRLALSIALWVIALVLMLAAAIYQRRTGPTYPFRGSFELAGQQYSYELRRSAVSTANAEITLPDPGGDVRALLYYRRHGTAEEFIPVPMAAENHRLRGFLPQQPPAGKLNYYIELDADGIPLRVPSATEGAVTIRFKGPVPWWALLPHIALMFFAILVGMRAGMSALFTPREMRAQAWIALGLITLGGMVFGPVVQLYAFGALWTGFPFGFDLTDNKTLIMWLAWIAALAAVTFWKHKSELTSRLIILAACAVMLWVYLVPHSLRGSELDYRRLEQGADPADAVVTGE